MYGWWWKYGWWSVCPLWGSLDSGRLSVHRSTASQTTTDYIIKSWILARAHIALLITDLLILKGHLDLRRRCKINQNPVRTFYLWVRWRDPCFWKCFFVVNFGVITLSAAKSNGIFRCSRWLWNFYHTIPNQPQQPQPKQPQPQPHSSSI